MSGTGGVVPGPPDHNHNRHMKPPQPGPGQGGVAGVAGGQVRREPPPGVQHQEHQEFDSWRHQTHQPQQGYNHLNSMASDPYLSSFYAGSYHYPGFGVGDGTWSNGGDHMTFLGSYGGGIPAGTEGGVPQPYGTDLSQATMFGAGAAGGFGAFTQPGYGFDFHNPAAAAAGAGYSQWGRGQAGEYYPRDPYTGHPGHGPETVDRQGRLAAAEQAMQGLSIATQPVEKEPLNGVQAKTERSHDKAERQSHEANGGSGAPAQSGGGHSKKMSWANIASQPAKPPPPPSKTKKPGVLPPPVVVGAVPGKHNMDIGMWDGTNQNGVPPPVITGPPPPVTGPPPMNGSVPPPGGRGPPIMAGVALTGPRGVKGPGVPQPFGAPPHINGPPPSPPSHPVLDELQSVNNYNPRDFDMNPKNARFFVLKSYSEDDVHRSIKYAIWCSTEHGNKRLDSAFRERDSRGPVFLFFSVNGSGHFCGMAEMMSCLDYSSSAGVWAQDKWKGKFQVRWIYVKDVPNSQLRHIRLENNENKPVTNSRDTQEVPPEKGKMVLKILHNYKHATSIFDDFIHYEKRQEEDEVRKPTSKNSPNDRGGREDRRNQDGRDGGRDDRDDRRRDDRRDDRRDNRNRDREHGGGGRGDHHRGGGEHHRHHRGENGDRNGDRNSDRDSAPRETGGGGRGGDRADRGGQGHGGRGRGGGGGGRGEQNKP